MSRSLAFVSFWVGLSISGVAHAWGDLGHETVAMIAQQNLSKDAKAFVASILGPEPMSLAAVWPDKVRSDAQNYKPFAAYHLCDLATPDALDRIGKDPSKDHDCYAVLNKGPKLLLDPSVSPLAKIIILRYMIHVAGDVHQPLHIGNGIDMGANLCDVRVEGNRGGKGKKTNLHKVWDTLLVEGLKKKIQSSGRSKGFFGASQLASSIQKRRSELMKSRFKAIVMSQDPLLWLRESAEVRLRSAYPDALVGFDGADDRKRPYCKYVQFDGRIRNMYSEQYDYKRIPVLTPEFQDKAQEIVEMQLFKGGLRLAGLLNRIAPKVDATKRPESPVKEVFRKMKNIEGEASVSASAKAATEEAASIDSDEERDEDESTQEGDK